MKCKVQHAKYNFLTSKPYTVIYTSGSIPYTNKKPYLCKILNFFHNNPSMRSKHTEARINH